jgi:hypothetical protein
MQIGDVVRYWDRAGKEHNALVAHLWSTCFLNIIYIERDSVVGTLNDYEDQDLEFGNRRIKEHAVPLYEEGMSGHYIKEWSVPLG